jgi:primosomal protein N' (replication factor Y)
LKRQRVPLSEPTRAQTLPIASVLVDSGLLHIDQEFEFLIPQELSQVITRGSLVKIPFNRKRVLGVVINRSEHGNFRGQLRYINEVVRDFPVITPEILDLAGEIVRYYGGNRWDVLRFAVPSFTKKSTVSHDANADTPQMPQQESKTSTSLDDQSTNYPEGFWKAFANL